MTTACVIVGVLVGFISCAYVITVLYCERRAALVRLGEVLDEHALCPVPVEVPKLRAVPARRDGSEYEWPAIVRAVEHDALIAEHVNAALEKAASDVQALGPHAVRIVRRGLR